MSGAQNSIIKLEVSDPEDLANAIRSVIFEPCLLKRSSMMSQMTRVLCPRVTLDFSNIGSSFLFTGVNSKDCYTMVFVLDCPDQGNAFNFGVEYHGGYMAFLAPGAAVDVLTPMGYSNAALSVPADVFHREVEHFFPEIPDPVLKNGLAFRVGTVAQQNLRSLVADVTAALSDPTMPLAGLTVRMELERRLLDAFLGALRDGVENRRLKPAHSERKLRQAREFLEASIDQPLHFDELCRELGMSRRGLEMMFRKSLGTTPGRYLQCQRLNGVRRALLGADSDLAMVKEVALEWGFLHMGHFGQHYRALFGETPRSTLARG